MSSSSSRAAPYSYGIDFLSFVSPCPHDAHTNTPFSLFHPQDDLDIIIGDLDSLTPAARDHFTTRPRPTRVIHDRDQESTDFGKAVRHVRENHHDGNNDNNDNNNNNGTANTTTSLDIVALGGLGGRVDQALSQLHHLHLFQADPHYAEGRMFLVGGESLTFLLKASGGRSHRVRVRERGAPRDDDVFDKYVGIVPVREPSVITTRGLEWDVEGWSTEMGGRVSTSNHVLPETEVVEVETTKDVLFTIALRQSR